MVKKNSSGPVLTQRDRKKNQSAITPDPVIENTEIEDNDPSKNIPATPQERLLKWLYFFVKENLTINRVVELSTLAFVVNLAYQKYAPTLEPNSEESNLIISALCGILALLLSIAVIYRSHSGKEHLPSWNVIYLIFLPAGLSLVLNRDLLLYNVALSVTVVELPIIAKLFIQFTIISSNIAHSYTPLFTFKIIVSHLVLNYALGKVSEFKSWDKVENNLFSILVLDLFLIKSDEIYVILLQKLLISFGASTVLIYSIIKLYPQNNLFRSIVVSIVWLSTFVYSALYQLDPIFEENSVRWLINYITVSDTRVKIISVWLISLLLLIPTIFNIKIKLSPNFSRKIWHFLVLILIAYPLYLDPEFVKLSLAGTLVLFLIVELVRYLKLYPLGAYIDHHLREFADFRDDKGPIIISYIYLIIGISLPVLFNNSVIGLTVLGVGDSLASIVGSNFGEIHWSNSSKTIEGTLTFILATFIVASGLKHQDLFFLDKSYHSLLLVSTLGGILEGNSELNDNILTPGYMTILLELLS